MKYLALLVFILAADEIPDLKQIPIAHDTQTCWQPAYELPMLRAGRYVTCSELDRYENI